MARERIFRFKHFGVVNDKTAMKVGTDGVLLGAWCELTDAQHVLDVGTGCGVISLMIAQRNPDCLVDAIDIDSASVDEAQLNFANSQWGERLQAWCCDFNDFVSTCNQRYDVVVSNPPFFTNGVLPADAGRNQARHTTSLTFEQLLSGANKLLSAHGNLMLITPVEAHEEIVECCAFNSLYVKRLTTVFPLRGGKPKRLLWQISKTPCVQENHRLDIEEVPGKYTDEYVALCRDFYLRF